MFHIQAGDRVNVILQVRSNGDRVTESGVVYSERIDTNGCPLYTILLDNPGASPNGIWTARRDELEAL